MHSGTSLQNSHSFSLSQSLQKVLPFMIKQKHGHIINMSPPIDLSMLDGSISSLYSFPFHALFILGKIAYCISKFGMTLQAHGIGQELKGTGERSIPVFRAFSDFLFVFDVRRTHLLPFFLRCGMQCAVASNRRRIIRDN